MPHDRLTPEGRRFMENLRALKTLQVRVGFQRGTDKYEDESEVDVCDVALWNELGTSTAPSRPFLRKSVDENKSSIDAMCQSLMKKVKDGEIDAETLYKQAGVAMVGLVQQKIKDGEYVPNAPATVAKKGSDKPLIDTGKMRQSVHYVVCKKGEHD